MNQKQLSKRDYQGLQTRWKSLIRRKKELKEKLGNWAFSDVILNAEKHKIKGVEQMPPKGVKPSGDDFHGVKNQNTSATK